MELTQMTLFDLLEEYDHSWKKIPDDASVNRVPREYDMPPRDLGGINHA